MKFLINSAKFYTVKSLYSFLFALIFIFLTTDLNAQPSGGTYGLLCEKLSETSLKQFDNNVFVKQNDSYKTLAFWSPSKADNCQT